MCGRYTAANPVLIGEMCFEEFDVHGPKMPARYNVAPSQMLFTIARDDSGKAIGQEMRWGLIPFWDKSEKPKIAPINAKSEDISAKPMFKQAVQKRRCLVPADGFFEWKKISEDLKQPYHIGINGGRPFYFAGIFEPASDTRPTTVAILTTRPNSLMETIHLRMPVMLTDDNAKEWLRAGELTSDELSRLSTPYPADKMRAFPVSTLVNNPRNNGPEILAPADAANS